MGELTGQVAMITGGARGQGRAHAVALAREGADIVVCDVGADLATVSYSMGTQDDLATTRELVEQNDQRCLTLTADVRDQQQMHDVVSAAVQEFGRLDILCANAGISTMMPASEMSDEVWDEMIAVNLTGVFHAIRAVLPQMREQQYGRIIATGSMASRGGLPGLCHYVAAKWGVLGLVKSVALEVANEGITVNAVCPGNVNTALVNNEMTFKLFRPDLEHPKLEDAIHLFSLNNAITKPWVEPEDISQAVLFYARKAAWCITGDVTDVALGWNAKNSA